MQPAEPKFIVRKKDMQLVAYRTGGRRLEVASPRIGSPVKKLVSFLREIPGGGRTRNHRHRNEAIIYILKGKGYTMVKKNRIDWEEGDVVAIPAMAWHTNVNLDPNEPALFLATINRPLIGRLLLFLTTRVLRMPISMKRWERE